MLGQYPCNHCIRGVRVHVLCLEVHAYFPGVYAHCPGICFLVVCFVDKLYWGGDCSHYYYYYYYYV